MTTELVDIAPDTRQILADLQRENMSWASALGEPLDNSLDASADQITVELDKKNRRVVVSDNGTGCAEPHRMFVSGYSTKKGSPLQLGRYGIGLKHASYYLAQQFGTTTVVSGSGDLFQTVRVCWNDLVERRAWKIDAPERISKQEALRYLPHGRGTCITFTVDKSRGWLTEEQFDKMLAGLAFTFSPALRAGRQIKFVRNGGRAKPLACPMDPAWSESLQFDVEVGHRKATVRAGILAPEDRSGRRGLSYGFAHRIIMADTQSGCGDYSTQGFAGYVDLDDKWTLGQNKSQVTDEAFQQLCDEIAQRLQPLLEKLKHAKQHLQMDALAGVLSDVLNQTLRGLRPKRPGKRGTQREESAKRMDRCIRQAAVVEGLGEILGRAAGRGGVSVQYEDRPDEEYAVRVDPNGTCVYMNTSKEAIGQAWRSNNWQMLAVAAAASLFNSDHAGNMFKGQTFADLMNAWLSRPIVFSAASAQSA